ncbi:hypothetical protein HPB47_003771 [Ixodes persulcatus]|uniref:Uncharacterized protein n=1 Tax=Ixodes persulcatus TaxID=34615 RepID=A0AC60PHH6_IXOPE|nr:hypothetical protein HPB47_003771 [Ixodes persulcatus]
MPLAERNAMEDEGSSGPPTPPPAATLRAFKQSSTTSSSTPPCRNVASKTVSKELEPEGFRRHTLEILHMIRLRLDNLTALMGTVLEALNKNKEDDDDNCPVQEPHASYDSFMEFECQLQASEAMRKKLLPKQPSGGASSESGRVVIPGSAGAWSPARRPIEIWRPRDRAPAATRGARSRRSNPSRRDGCRAGLSRPIHDTRAPQFVWCRKLSPTLRIGGWNSTAPSQMLSLKQNLIEENKIVGPVLCKFCWGGVDLIMEIDTGLPVCVISVDICIKHREQWPRLEKSTLNSSCYLGPLSIAGPCLCGRDLIQELNNLETPVLSVSYSKTQGKGEGVPKILTEYEEVFEPTLGLFEVPPAHICVKE